MKRLLFFLISLSLSLSISHIAYAHPIDVASVVIPLNGEQLPDSTYRIPITWSVTIPEIMTTLKLNVPQQNVGTEILDVSGAKIPLSNYLADKLLLMTEKGPCAWQTDHMQETIVLDDLSLIGFHGFMVCPVLPQSLTITNTAFLKEFPYQTNIIIITKDDSVVLQKELTAMNKTTRYPEAQAANRELGTENRKPTELNSGSLTARFEDIFRKLLLSSIPGAILVAFLVGFLHSLEAGHSKTILASLMLRHDATIRQGLSYSLVFTVTHIADILLFGLILLILNSTINIFTIIARLNQYALVILLWIAAYMVITNVLSLIREKRHKHLHEYEIEHDHAHDHSHAIEPRLSFGKQLWIGFLTGLAPCVMGWSIFFLILSTKTVWAVIPVILAFGAGIYLSLIGTTFLVYKGKQTIFKRISFLSLYSPLISSVLLLIFSIILILKK